jgi:hypothetical protein
MQFKYYDTLSSLISGSVLLFVLSLAIGWDIKDVNVVILLAVAYVLGYLINAISAMAEPVYYWFMGGLPSDKLLTPPMPSSCGKERKYTGFGRIRFYEYEKAIRLLREELDDDKADPRKMFGKAMSYSNSNDKTRVPDFNAHYAFSRVMLTLVIISAALMMTQYYNKWWSWVIAVGVILLFGIRCKERGYYYAKEVLVEYINAKEQK